MKGITSSKHKAQLIAEAAKDKKAEDIVVMNMRRASSIADYFVIASGNSTTHVKAITENIEKSLKQEGATSWRIEGYDNLLWVLIDCSSVIAHVFLKETRSFYDLERLWGDAPKTYI